MTKIETTERGFGIYNFKDKYGIKCSIQESSLASESCIWFGVSDPEPKIRDIVGWKPYNIPPEVLLSTRMHLTQEQVRELLPILQNFANSGYLLGGDE